MLTSSRKQNPADAQIFLVYFVSLYMFRAYLGPSSGSTDVCVQQLGVPMQPE